MARFAFSMQASLFGLRGRTRVSDRSLQALCLPSSTEVEHGSYSGWWDSSHELRQGLDVREGLPSDAPVDAWLTLWLCTAQPTALAA